MSRVGTFVLGPAGVGKTTFCNSLVTYMQTIGRRVHIVNLDPAAGPKEYEFSVDIRDLISLEDVMEEFNLGPNGGLIYCFEYLMERLDWFDEEIGDYNDEFLLFDCPGQIELYTHCPVIPALVKHLQMSLGFRLCVTYLLESSFVVDSFKFFSGALSAMSTMILIELPHINILSKIDLVKTTNLKKKLKRFLNPNSSLIFNDNSSFNNKYKKLNKLIAGLVEDYGMVQFLPMDCNQDHKYLKVILSYIDDLTQWAENQEPKEINDEMLFQNQAYNPEFEDKS